MLYISRRIFGFCFILFLSFVVRSAADVSAPNRFPALDLRAAFDTHSYRVSRYLVDKYYSRYVEGIRSKEKRDISPAEQARWLRVFFAQQQIVDYAISQGYKERPEVQNVVERMEANMLSSVNGPFYDKLVEGYLPLTGDSFRSLYKNANGVTEGVIAQFDAGARADTLLGADFDQQNTDEKLRRVAVSRGKPGVRVTEDSLQWPFNFSPAVIAAFLEAPTGTWTRVTDASGGTSLILVEKRISQAGAPAKIEQSAFLAFMNFARRESVQSQRKARVLNELQFSPNRAIAAQLAKRIVENNPPDALISLLPADPLAAAALCDYRDRSGRISISVIDFCKRFNGQFIRQLPISEDQVVNSVADLVVAQMDIQDAKESGVDQTSQFREDRKGFEGFQILDLFEKERITPTIAVNAEAESQYFQAHLAEFTRTQSVECRVISFDSASNAEAWGRASADDRAKPTLFRSNRLIVLGRGDAIPGLEALRDYPQDCPEGTVIGPFQQGTGAVLIIKERNLARSSLASDLASSTIRPILLRRALDEKEVQMAADLARIKAPIIHLEASELASSQRPKTLSSL